MKFFPVQIVRWREPVPFSYRRQKNSWKAMGPILIGIVVLSYLRQLPWWGSLALAGVTGLLLAIPWINSRWPGFLPLKGSVVTLFEDRIARQAGRTQIYIALQDMGSCVVTARTEQGALFFVLTMTSKTGRTFSVLKETAISDRGCLDQVLAYLRGKGVRVSLEC